MTCSSVAAVPEGPSVPLLMLKVSPRNSSLSTSQQPSDASFCNLTFSFFFFKPPSEPFVPEEPSFPTPSSPPPPRPPDPLPAQEASSSPSRHSMGLSSGSVSDPFSPSAGSCVTEQGLLGSVLSLCEDVSRGAEPPSPWAGEGGYGRAPGFEREDQVRRTDKEKAYPACFHVTILIFLLLFVVSG